MSVVVTLFAAAVTAFLGWLALWLPAQIKAAQAQAAKDAAADAAANSSVKPIEDAQTGEDIDKAIDSDLNNI